jgi:hypothetical protein
VEGPALRNLGNHKRTLVPIPADTADAEILEDEVNAKQGLSIQRGFLLMTGPGKNKNDERD